MKKLALFITCALLLSNTEAQDRYKLIKTDPYENFKLCHAGGFLYKNNYIQATNLYTSFKKNHPNCKKVDTLASGSLKNSNDKVHNIASALEKSPQCPKLQAIASQFLNSESATKNKIEKDYEVIKSNVTKQSQDYKIQVEASLLAWGYSLCDAGFMGQKLKDRLDMYNAIRAIEFNTPPDNVLSDGDHMNSCENLNATGENGVIKRFSVSLENTFQDKLHFSYHTYSIKDRIVILDNMENKIFDTGCVETKITKSVEITMPTSSKIYIDVDSDCEGKHASNWHVHLSCGRPVKKISKKEKAAHNICRQKANQILAAIQEDASMVFAAQQFRWSTANCYEEHYKKMAKDYTNMIFPKSFFKISGNTDYEIKKVNSKKNKLEAKSKKIEKKKINQKVPKHETSKQESSFFVYGYNDFIKKKKKYCPELPDEKTPLFKKISSAYCNYGIPRLFRPDDEESLF